MWWSPPNSREFRKAHILHYLCSSLKLPRAMRGRKTVVQNSRDSIFGARASLVERQSANLLGIRRFTG